MKKTKGFTLIEIIVVVSILVILSSIAIPATLSQMRKSTDRKYYIEAKLIESAVEIYNSERTGNIIGDFEQLLSVKGKLTTGGKKYITSWPSKLKVIVNGEETEVNNNSLNSYRIDQLLGYISKKEKNYK